MQLRRVSLAKPFRWMLFGALTVLPGHSGDHSRPSSEVEAMPLVPAAQAVPSVMDADDDGSILRGMIGKRQLQFDPSFGAHLFRQKGDRISTQQIADILSHEGFSAGKVVRVYERLAGFRSVQRPLPVVLGYFPKDPASILKILFGDDLQPRGVLVNLSSLYRPSTADLERVLDHEAAHIIDYDTVLSALTAPDALEFQRLKKPGHEGALTRWFVQAYLKQTTGLDPRGFVDLNRALHSVNELRANLIAGLALTPSQKVDLLRAFGETRERLKIEWGQKTNQEYFAKETISTMAVIESYRRWAEAADTGPEFQRLAEQEPLVQQFVIDYRATAHAVRPEYQQIEKVAAAASADLSDPRRNTAHVAAAQRLIR